MASPPPKHQVAVAVSARQLAALEAEAERLAVRIPDVIRKVLDEWIDRSGVKAADP